ncbi:MAG: DUF58 domain-containing protein [Verrucomicrobiota bacterium]
MADVRADQRTWQDWTDPEFFNESKRLESRFVPLFFRQIFPARVQQTKLTLTGWMLIVVSLGIGSAAYNTSSNILFMTLSLLLSSLILSGILSHMNFRKMRWSLEAPSHLQVGEVGMSEVDIDNRKNLFPTMGICFCVESDAEEEAHRLYAPYVMSARETAKLEWSIVPKERGFCTVRIVGIESKFPFGFLRKAKLLNVETEVPVWPARIDYFFEPIGSGRRFLSGAIQRKPGQGNDLLNVRSYERGDPLRSIHWKATARMNRLMVRQLAEEGESGFHIVVEPDADLWTEAGFERMCSLVCSLADDLFQSDRLESITIAGESPEMIREIRDVHDFFNRLATMQRRKNGLRLAGITQANTITLRPAGLDQISIYIGEHETGQTNA